MIEWLDQFWQSLHPAMQVIIGGLTVAALIGIIALLIRLIRKLTVPSPEKKKEQDKKLRIHFEDLKGESRKITTDLSEVYGEVVGSSRLHWHHLKEDELRELSDAFIAHFSKEATEWAKCISAINAHNGNRRAFCVKVKEVFESKGIDVGAYRSVKPSPYIYDAIFDPLFSWWEDRSQKKANPSPDFQRIQTTLPGRPDELYAYGWDSASIAYAKNDDDKKKCIEAIHELAKNKVYEREAANLLTSADALIDAVKALAQKLNEKIYNVDKFWPGTKSYKFKKLVKKCPKCKEIFG